MALGLFISRQNFSRYAVSILESSILLDLSCRPRYMRKFVTFTVLNQQMPANQLRSASAPSLSNPDHLGNVITA